MSDNVFDFSNLDLSDVRAEDWSEGSASTISAVKGVEPETTVQAKPEAPSHGPGNVETECMPLVDENGFQRRSRFLRERFEDIQPRSTDWRVKGLLPLTGLVYLAGPSGAGKSFLAIDWALRIAAGRDVMGRRTRPCPVIYVAAEAPDGVRRRVFAWREHHDPSAAFELIPVAPDLTSQESVEDLATTLREASADFADRNAGDLGLVIIDTLSASAPGVAENESQTMSVLLHRLQTMARELNMLVMVVGHTGKDQARGIRGWSGQHAAADAVIMIRRDDDGAHRLGRLEKQKDGEDGAEFAFTLERIVIGQDSDGEDVTTALVQYTDNPKTKKADKLSDSQKIVLEAIGYCLDHYEVEGPGIVGMPPEAPCITREMLRDRLREMDVWSDISPDSFRPKFSRSLDGLKAKGLIRCEKDHIWRLDR